VLFIFVVNAVVFTRDVIYIIIIIVIVIVFAAVGMQVIVWVLWTLLGSFSP
jgi:hypothetical protein